MQITERELKATALKERFRPDVLEKSWLLLTLLDAINTNEQLKGKFALKGGTALNLFYFDTPRLSVDIDLNYVGGATLEAVNTERDYLEQQLELLYSLKKMSIKRNIPSHAGGKYEIRYDSVLNEGKGSIEVDLNYMYRIPLFPLQEIRSSDLGGIQTTPIKIVSFEEAAAGKLAALLNRNAARDLFDAYHIFYKSTYDPLKLKTALLAYYVMKERDIDHIPVENVQVDPVDLKNMLQPVLRKTEAYDTDQKCLQWAHEAAKKVRSALDDLLQLNTHEQQFLTDHKNGRKLNFGLITEDVALVEKLENHPLIKWVQQKRATASKGRGI